MKKNVIIGAVLIILLVAVIFVWFKKRTTDVKIQNPISQISDQQKNASSTDEQQTTQNDQPAENIPAEKTNPPAPATNNDTKNNTSDNSSSTKSTGKIVDRFISWGFQKSSNRKIDTIIIHSSYDALGKDPYSVSGVIAEFKQYGVSAHYLIARDGTIYHLVADQNIAYHAGVSTMPDGRTGVNGFSIGIEVINTLDGKFTIAQYSALNQLIASLKKQYPIKYILGHRDIAPGRKTDPWGIDWNKVQK